MALSPRTAQCHDDCDYRRRSNALVGGGKVAGRATRACRSVGKRQVCGRGRQCWWATWCVKPSVFVTLVALSRSHSFLHPSPTVFPLLSSQSLSSYPFSVPFPAVRPTRWYCLPNPPHGAALGPNMSWSQHPTTASAPPLLLVDQHDSPTSALPKQYSSSQPSLRKSRSYGDVLRPLGSLARMVRDPTGALKSVGEIIWESSPDEVIRSPSKGLETPLADPGREARRKKLYVHMENVGSIWRAMLHTARHGPGSSDALRDHPMTYPRLTNTNRPQHTKNGLKLLPSSTKLKATTSGRSKLLPTITMLNLCKAACGIWMRPATVVIRGGCSGSSVPA
jgi:hypothetical protein